jgi:hypothetical protein
MSREKVIKALERMEELKSKVLDPPSPNGQGSFSWQLWIDIQKFILERKEKK